MKVLDLHCSHDHVFEGWFASEDEFQSQLSRGLVACPICADTQINKKLSAPRLNLNTSRRKEPVAAEVESQTHSHKDETAQLPSHQEVANFAPAELQATLLKMVRHVMANTEDVGNKFSEEARKIHYGEAEHRNIRGHATPQETEELLDEGIQVMPLPMPDFVKETLQ
jgi:hypothetical protein